MCNRFFEKDKFKYKRFFFIIESYSSKRYLKKRKKGNQLYGY